MIIANPIYDTVFKQLMENTKVATFIIQTLLTSGQDSSETITNLTVKPQELTVRNPEGLALVRFDFVATIKNSKGEHKKVLIEIQKARNVDDIERFRKYLGSQYMILDEIDTSTGTTFETLPIITIYLLGFKLSEWTAPAVKQGRFAEDLTNHSIIKEKCDFAEKLTHDAYFVQLPRIESKFGSRLEKLLSVFEQKYFVDKQGMIKDYPFDIDDEDIKTMVNLLHYTGTDPEEKKRIEDEVEAWRVFNTVLEAEKKREFAEIRELVKEQEKAIEEKDKAIEENLKAMQEKDKEIEELKRQLGMK